MKNILTILFDERRSGWYFIAPKIVLEHLLLTYNFVFSLSLSLLFRWTNVSKAYLTIVEIRFTNLSLHLIGLSFIVNKYMFFSVHVFELGVQSSICTIKEERWRNGYAWIVSKIHKRQRWITVLRSYCL